MLESGVLRKYLFYAIGEILLVVIGILIALEVNNWNENRKVREKEVDLLLELKADLEETRHDLLTDIEKTEQMLNTTNAFYKAIDENQISTTNPFKLSTGYILEAAILFPKLNAYEAIQSEGITIISNDNLRKEISDFYQLYLERVSSAEAYLQDLDNTLLKPYLIEVSGYGSTCKDCPDLFALYRTDQDTQENLYLIPKVDDKLVHILKEKFVVYRTLNHRYLELSRLIDEIIFSIVEEANSKK